MHTRSLVVNLRNAMKPRLCVLLFVLALLFSETPLINCAQNFQVVENTTEPHALVGSFNYNVSNLNSECQHYFYLDGNELKVAVQLDREEIISDPSNEDTLYCTVLHSGSFIDVHIEILDVNDNVPRFNELEPVHTHELAENFNTPNPLISLEPVDEDYGENGTVEFRISAGNEEGFFYIGPPLEYDGTEIRLQLFANHSINYEQHKSFNLTISIHDLGIPQLDFDQIIIINIKDVDDEEPDIVTTHIYVNIRENHSVGPLYSFGEIPVIDQDTENSSIMFSFSEGDQEPDNVLDYIGLNNRTGQLYLKQAIDYEVDVTLHEMTLFIKVGEEGGTYIDIAIAHITLEDVNDVAPVINIFRNEAITENSYLGSPPFLVVKAYDIMDGISEPTITSQPPFDIKIKTVFSLYAVTINGSVDREQVDQVTFNITVYDQGTPPLAATKIVVIQVLDENDNSPIFTEPEYRAIVGDDAPLLKLATTVKAIDADIGENSSVSYWISSVSPDAAESWFNIDSLSGEIRVSGPLNYSLVERVSLVVTASDNGTCVTRTTNTTVDISISPAITFKPWSYQEHCLPDTKIQDASTQIYLEFRTTEKDGLLLYQESAQGEQFSLSIEHGELIAVAHNQVQTRFSEFDVSSNEWISVLYDFEKKMMNVSNLEKEEGIVQPDIILQAFEHVRCDTELSSHHFFVGGIDIFSHTHNNLSESFDFIGNIKNLVIDSVRVDMASPVREVNTLRGVVFTSEPKCGEMEVECSGPHYAGCLDYDLDSHCICSGGFKSDTCNEEKNYAPIQLSSSSNMRLTVNYELFVDLFQRSSLVFGTLDVVPATVKSRRSTTETPLYQHVEFQFRPLRNSTGTLLYSKTNSAIHNLQINGPSSSLSTEYTIVYTVSDIGSELTSTHAYMADTFSYVLGDVYTVSIHMTTDQIAVSFNGSGTPRVYEWSTVAPFIEYPHTEISIGGASDSETTSDFTGCVIRLAVNGIEFPLNGLVERNDSSIKISGGGGGSSVSTTCDLCQQEAPCRDNMTCTNYVDSYTCECLDGLERGEEGECVEPPTFVVVTDPTLGVSQPRGSAEFPLYYVLAGAAGASIVVAVVVTVFCCLCCRRRKRRNQKTYRVGGGQELPSLRSGALSASRQQNKYADVPPRRLNSDQGYMTVSRHQHESSSSTSCNDHDIDEDIESQTQNMTRSKSSTSGETGFHTASERDDQRSLPRMDDSGNEKETDYSPFDTESDGSQSYVDMQTHTGLRLKGRPAMLPPFSSPSDSLGPISGVGAPLTPKEKKFITPLRPDSRSELGEETDLDTDFSSTVFTRQNGRFSRGYRGGSLKLTGRPESGMSGHQWYKDSTYSDNERERKRTEGAHAYYPPNQFQSFRRTRACSASLAQPGEFEHPQMPPPRSSLTPPRGQPPSSRSGGKGDSRNSTSPVSPLTTQYSNHHHHHHHHHQTLPSSSSRGHQKEERDHSSKTTSDTSEFSTSVLSRPAPMKMHPAFLRQCSDSPRVPVHLASRPYVVPSYMRSFSEESTLKEEKKFVDLGSMRTTCDPIQYWEGQRRMMATVDQVGDAFPVLSESFTPYEDSAGETQQSGPEHHSFSSQGGGEGTAEALDMGLLRDCDDGESVATGTTLKGEETALRVILFPSADCSEEYRCSSRLVMPAMMGANPNMLQHSCSGPPSQGTFEV